MSIDYDGQYTNKWQPGPEQIQADEKLYEAKLFNGCILSNEVKLTVE
ncbi:MAG: hypothetical protein ACKO96_08650 [Flammeovirgaceae bacterium]